MLLHTYIHTYFLANLLTYLLTPWSRVLLEKLTGFQLIKKFPAFLWNPKARYTRIRHQFLSEARSIQSMPPPFLSPHQNPVYASPSPVRLHAPPISSSRFYHPKNMGEEYRSLSSSLYSFIHSPVTSSLLGSNIILNALFSNTLSLRSFLNVSDQVSHPYKTGNIIVLYILIFKFLISNWKTKDFAPNDSNHSRIQSALNFFLNRILIY